MTNFRHLSSVILGQSEDRSAPQIARQPGMTNDSLSSSVIRHAPQATPIRLTVRHCPDTGKLAVGAVEEWEHRYSAGGFVGGVTQFVAGLLPRPMKPLNGPGTRFVLADRAGKLLDFELGAFREARG